MTNELTLMLRKLVLNATYYTGLQAALKPVFGGIGSILTLHRVRDLEPAAFSPNRHLNISPRFLDDLLASLSPAYDFVSMDEVAKRIRTPFRYEKAKPFLAVTLDDGYVDNIENAAPVFRKYKVPYMIYIAPGMVDGTHRIWWEDLEHIIANTRELVLETPQGVKRYAAATPVEKAKAYHESLECLFVDAEEGIQREIVSGLCARHGVDDLAHVKSHIASWEQLNELVKTDPLCCLGAHSMGHWVLSKLAETDLKYELEESQRVITEKTGKEIRHFAYPYGYPEAAGPREFDMAKSAGFTTAVTMRHGVLYPSHAAHMTALPRVSINGLYQTKREVKTLLSGVPTRLKNRGHELDIA